MVKKLKIIIFSLICITAFATVLIAQKPKASKEHLFIETDFGTIEIAFFPDKAPKHVEAIKKLANQGFYNGTLFHRVIPAEFNDVSHRRGICSMARSQSINSAGSQFFICVADSTFLDGQYTVWGEVVSGMDVVDKIVSLRRDANDNPIEPARMNKVYVK